MNIHFPQVERKSQVFSYMLAVFALFTMLMLASSFIRVAELRLSIPSTSIDVAQTEKTNRPLAVPAPMPPAEQSHAIATPEPVESTQSIPVPQIIPAPAPSVP